MMIYDNIGQLIGRTPLVRLHLNNPEIKAELLAKVESFNPGGSIKDRVGAYMLLDAEEKGMIAPGATIIEPTSGNTGVGLALMAAVKGYKMILTMPENMSAERQSLLKAYGAEIILTPAADGMAGAIAKAEAMLREIPGSYMCGQFDNEANPMAHYLTTAQEIYADTDGKVDIVVAAIGTGGTITGIARGLKEYHKDIQIIGVEPLQSAVINGRPKGAHKIQGIGAGFIPSILDLSLIDEVLMIDGDEAMAESRMLAKTQGILCGISAGAALLAAEQVGSRPENEGKRIVVILPDTGERYLSTELFRESN
ncbi:MAG: cysteine synthase A [Peptococcaceae bacterium]|nr:cysteine synthase A [Peptococcaceae bacterium]MBQ5683042.1 cysteine synthase A [Peptococcaceae bacterium]MBQ5703184.1 cysteine synthase A [Peptococcaceae bacterium]